MTLAEMERMVSTLPKPTRDVFRFDGSMVEFEAILNACGVYRLLPKYQENSASSLLPAIYGLGLWEINGAVWIAASYTDVNDAFVGKIPFKTIANPNVPAKQDSSQPAPDPAIRRGVTKT